MVIAPYFLSRGRHIQEDIPALVHEAQAKHPGLQCIIAQPIGEKGYQSGEGGKDRGISILTQAASLCSPSLTTGRHGGVGGEKEGIQFKGETSVEFQASGGVG